MILVGRYRRRRFLNSEEYRHNLEMLNSFTSKVQECLSKNDLLGDATIFKIVTEGTAPLSFFRNARFRLDDEVSATIAQCDNFESLLHRHDVEVRLACEFANPIESMLAKPRYIPHSEWQSFSISGSSLADSLPPGDFVFPESKNNIRYVHSAAELVEKHNSEFVEAESNRLSGFFSTLAKYPLDVQQKRCCIVDEDANLVIAGAGSGKTSVIMAKVAYLLKVRGVPPERILLISFTNKAAKEMSERIADCLGLPLVFASTFHKFGLGIIRRFSPGRYDVADDAFLKRTIHKAMTGNDDFTPELYESAVDFFAYHLDSDVGLGGRYATFADKIEHDRQSDLRTLKSIVSSTGANITLGGEKVKSAEEVLIANFLFLNGVEYEYEKKYDKPYPDDGQHRVYHPDFYLPKYEIYLEHYGIDEHGRPPQFFSAAERMKYKVSMEWKRRLHAEAGNKYIETYSWWCQKGVLFDNLKRELSGLGVAFNPLDRREVLRLLCEKSGNQLDEVEKLLATFITLFKANGYPLSMFDEMSRTEASSEISMQRQVSFLRLAKSIFLRYTEELEKGGLFDFSDMINKSARIVDGLPKNTLTYSHVIVDEYQDVSTSQKNLLKAVIGNTGAHLFCVGDDWQSIYRFAGSDMSLFTHFENHFGHTAKMWIENTYRNSQELIDITGRFVMMNRGQLPKKLRSERHCVSPIETIPYNGDKGKSDALREAARRIYRESQGEETTVLLLGRTKYDDKVVLDSPLFVSAGRDRYRIHQAPNLMFEFMTVHKSKGLEGDYVILLNAEAGNLGFPNKIADDPVLQLVMGAPEEFEFAEERRLFYVALTRTRNKTYILVPDVMHSNFIDDLYRIGVEDKNLRRCEAAAHLVSCPKCAKGHLVRRKGLHGSFSGCSNYPQCDYTVNFLVAPDTPRCPSCGAFLVKRYMKSTSVPFYGCTNYPYCEYTCPVEKNPERREWR